MNKKKLSALLLAGTLTAGVVGGTFAWFTSQDTVTNQFATAGTDEPDNPDAGIDIWEKFEEPTNVVPGTTTDKLVQVKNTSTYDQFIRVKITPKWEKEGLNSTYLQLNFTDYLKETGEEGTWIEGGDGYYYYIGKVAGGKFTNTLLESVTLKDTTPNEYKNQKYKVVVDAESIQADNGAYDALWSSASQDVKTALENCKDSIGNADDAGTTATP